MAEPICKRCIHHDICGAYTGEETITFFPYNEDCEHFENKADVVEVVRCKDCLYYGGITYGNVCRRFSALNVKNCTKPTDFCSFGVAKMDRKGEGE